MASFDLAYSFLLPNEDYTPPRYEVVPDPTKNDPNAQAVSGINSAYWPEDFAAIVALPQSERGPAVESFYRQRFWNQWLEQMTSNRVAAMVLDASVNQGAGWATKFLQTACGATVDGAFGPNTLAAVNSTSPEIIVPAFIEAREARYREVGGPSLPQWLVRARKVPEFV